MQQQIATLREEVIEFAKRRRSVAERVIRKLRGKERSGAQLSLTVSAGRAGRDSGLDLSSVTSPAFKTKRSPRDYLGMLPRMEEKIPELCTVFAGRTIGCDRDHPGRLT